ncbi:phosphopantetheine-binding protein [Herbaspirillum lusitanum]|uniref:Phosphopantetheine-binding protein n=1 Tax=Herbaspirillum lusitanum TaxID=213312 RepID=A0ABW9A6M5_9BURK
MHTVEQIKALLGESLGLGARADALHADSLLLGNIAELDSAAVINVITGMEERFGLSIADDEIDAGLFESVGSLAAFVDRKLGQ